MDFHYVLIGGIVLVIIWLIISAISGSPKSKAFKVVRHTHDPSGLIAAIDADKTSDIPTEYNAYIKTLWDAYDRETATKLIQALLERNDTAPISQFWLKTLLEVEPELARTLLGEAFITSHYKEGIAAKCGGGCCGGGGGAKSCKSCKSCK